MRPFALGSAASLRDLQEVAEGRKVSLPPAARARMARARRAAEAVLRSGRKVYGVNTGFGQLAIKRISPEDVRTLNLNYVRAHASGVGEPLSVGQSRGIVFLRANELARGFSACRPEVVERLAALLNSGVTPLIPSQGSVGASGDLAPMAHVAMVLIGEGTATKDGRRLQGAAALKAARIRPLVPEAKEGLALTNGTQALQSVGGLALIRAYRALDAADQAAAMSLEAVKGTPAPYDARLSALKAHPGQTATAARLRGLLAGSPIRESHREGDERVQDPYSFRCVPQIHGAVRDALDHARAVVEREMGSVTDNPVCVGGEFLSGGNFHGMAIAMALDHAALAMAVAGGVSERRTYYMTSGAEGVLPLFLAESPGLESGYMIPQYVAAALASENKTLAHPASADSVPTSAQKEDYVSMGMWAATKLARAAVNVTRIVAIELMTAARGVEHHAPLKPAAGVARTLKAVRAAAPAEHGDRSPAPTIEALRGLIARGGLEAA